MKEFNRLSHSEKRT